MLKVVAAFAPARDSISWAGDAISEFEMSANRFFGPGVAEIINETDPASGENVQKLRLLRTLPNDLARKATEALTNTKYAFDRATFAARNLTSGPSKKSIYFPWSKDPIDLKFLLKARGIDERLWATFQAHAPYSRSDAHAGGDDILRSLATLANTKHTVGLSVHGHIAGTEFPDINPQGLESLSISMARWDPVKNEAELVRWRGNLDIIGENKYKFAFDIYLKDAGLPEPVSALHGLRAFHRKAQSVVEDLQTRCLEICS